MVEKREKIGKISSQLLEKEPDTRDPIELERAMHQDYESNIVECVQEGSRKFSSNFYVVVITKKEKLMPNVIRNYFIHRLTCPTPDYDQTVYFYNRKEDYLEFMWVIPSKDTCDLLRFNALQVDQKEKELLKYVLEFYDGSLLDLARRLNKEHEDKPLVLA
jgi:hypothetical protein